MVTSHVPLLIVTGPMGVGKRAVLHEADRILVQAKMSHATVVFER